MTSSHTKDAKILVVGAGPVGLTAAIELQRRGFRPRIIDQAAGPAGESRALGIHARTLEIFEPTGITTRLLEHGNRVTRVVFWDDRRQFMKIDFSLARQEYNFALIMPQSKTELILLEQLEKSGMKVEWETPLDHLTIRDDRPECKIGGQVGAESYDYVIGCDGSRSTVRQALDIGFSGSAYDHDWYLADVRFEGERSLSELRIKPANQCLLAYFPLEPDVGRFVSDSPELMQLIENEVALTETIWQSDFRISHRIVESYQRGKVFLAGDAAHVHSPVGGRGMNLGIEDAATLAWLIETGQTERYTEMRRPLGESVLRFTDFQTRQLTSRNPVIRFGLRYLGPVFLKSKGIQRYAFRQISGANTVRPPWL